MPPITTISLTEDAVDLIEQLDRRYKDLKDFQIPRLRDYKGSLAGQQRYGTELREDMERFSQLLQVCLSLRMKFLIILAEVSFSLWNCSLKTNLDSV